MSNFGRKLHELAKAMNYKDKWHCDECDSWFASPEQYLSDDLPTCPLCKSEDIHELGSVEYQIAACRWFSDK